MHDPNRPTGLAGIIAGLNEAEQTFPPTSPERAALSSEASNEFSNRLRTLTDAVMASDQRRREDTLAVINELDMLGKRSAAIEEKLDSIGKRLDVPDYKPAYDEINKVRERADKLLAGKYLGWNWVHALVDMLEKSAGPAASDGAGLREAAEIVQRVSDGWKARIAEGLYKGRQLEAADIRRDESQDIARHLLAPAARAALPSGERTK